MCFPFFFSMAVHLLFTPLYCGITAKRDSHFPQCSDFLLCTFNDFCKIVFEPSTSMKICFLTFVGQNVSIYNIITDRFYNITSSLGVFH